MKNTRIKFFPECYRRPSPSHTSNEYVNSPLISATLWPTSYTEDQTGCNAKVHVLVPDINKSVRLRRSNVTAISRMQYSCTCTGSRKLSVRLHAPRTGIPRANGRARAGNYACAAQLEAAHSWLRTCMHRARPLLKALQLQLLCQFQCIVSASVLQWPRRTELAASRGSG